MQPALDTLAALLRGDATDSTVVDSLRKLTAAKFVKLNAIMGYAELLAMELSGPATAGHGVQLERLQSSSRHLLQLVNEVLDLAKIESGTLRVAVKFTQPGVRSSCQPGKRPARAQRNRVRAAN